jgi:hypothetical protein
MTGIVETAWWAARTTGVTVANVNLLGSRKSAL